MTMEPSQQEEGRSYQVCVRCASHSPETLTSYTLISARFGWRLHRRIDKKSGMLELEWYCPKCWKAKKEAEGGPISR